MEPEYKHKITTSINKKGYKTYKLRAEEGYCFDVDVLAKLQDTGNGYLLKVPSYSSCEMDRYLNIGYAEIEYIAELYEFMQKGESK